MAPNARQRRTALVVDDEPGMRSIVRRHLTRDGLEVSEASGAADAVASLDTGRFDLLVCDLRLPDGSGMEVVARAKAARPAIATVMMSGQAGHQQAPGRPEHERGLPCVERVRDQPHRHGH